MAGFWFLRTLSTTSCLLVALLAGGSVRGISFSAIELNYAVAFPADVSPDGSRVVGRIVLNGADIDCGSFSRWGCGPQAFVWTADRQFEPYVFEGFPASIETGGNLSAAFAVATSNAAILSHTAFEYGANPNRTRYGGPILLTTKGPLLLAAGHPDTESMTATGLSADATVVVGTIGLGNGPRGGFRWTKSGGLDVFGDMSTSPTTISGDGQVIAGASTYIDFRRDTAGGFRWTELEGFTTLPDAADGRGFGPLAISFDGSAIAGVGWREGTGLPLIWTEETGTGILPLLESYVGGWASDMTADGAWIVGSVFTKEKIVPTLGPDDFGQQQAVFWKDGNVHNLQTWLTQNHNLGDELAGWSLISANAISADGRVIAGVGINPSGHFQGWVVDLSPAAVVPEPATSMMLLAAASLIIAAGSSLGARVSRAG
jgi:hypothetical protein